MRVDAPRPARRCRARARVPRGAWPAAAAPCGVAINGEVTRQTLVAAERGAHCTAPRAPAAAAPLRDSRRVGDGRVSPRCRGRCTAGCRLPVTPHGAPSRLTRLRSRAGCCAASASVAGSIRCRVALTRAPSPQPPAIVAPRLRGAALRHYRRHHRADENADGACAAALVFPPCSAHVFSLSFVLPSCWRLPSL